MVACEPRRSALFPDHPWRTALAQRLETLEPETPVYCGQTRVGVVDGVYSEGKSEVAEYLAVRWETRGNVAVLVPTKDVQSLDARGVNLVGADPGQYATLPPFNPKAYPHFRRLH